jgi:hypothetical protein
MSDRWISVLMDAGANLREGQVADFGAPEAEAAAALNGDIISDLTQFSVMEVSGDDAQNFLSGQFTSDIMEMRPGQSHLTAWCSAQGRVLAIFRILRRPDGFWLLFPRVLKDVVTKRLQMFVLRAKVELRDRSETLVGLGMSGDGVAAFLSEHLVSPPATVNHAAHGADYSLIRIAGEKPRFIIIGSEEAIITLWTHAAGVMRPVGPASWTLTDIEAAQPWIVEATREQFLPQVLNLDALGGISFNKGCYPGQEVIARLKFRGEVKQRLFRGRTGDSTVVPPGTKLYLPHGENSVGEIVLSAADPDGGQALLAALRLDLADSKDLHLGAANGPSCEFHEPPYAVDT